MVLDVRWSRPAVRNSTKWPGLQSGWIWVGSTRRQGNRSRGRRRGGCQRWWRRGRWKIDSSEGNRQEVRLLVLTRHAGEEKQGDAHTDAGSEVGGDS